MSTTTTTPSRRTSTRPWRKESDNKKVFLSTPPLIPEEYIDVGQQRLLAISVFVLIQAYKFYELFFQDNSAFVAKFVLIESAYVWILPILRIPWLTFPFYVTVTQIFGLALFNMFLGNNAISLSGMAIAAWKGIFDRELSLSGSKVRTKDFRDTTFKNLGGKFTVHILPESTALLNPLKTTYCTSGEHNVISIPVRLNATEPVHIQLTRVDLRTLEEESIEFNKKDIRKLKVDALESIDEPRLSYIGLPVQQPGLYRLSKVLDGSNMDVRIYSSDVLIPSCPSAYILGADESASYTDRCIGDTETPKLVVDGVPPLKVKYSRSIKGRESVFSVQSVQPEGYVSPLIYGGLPQSGFKWKGDGESLSWASSSTVEVDMDTSLTTTGEWMYVIEEVEDAFGNVVDYSQIYGDRADPKLLFSKSLSYGFMVHPRPQIRFKNCDAENPLKLAKGRAVDVPLELSGDTMNGPYEVEFERVALDDDADSASFTEKFEDRSIRYTVKDAGVYKLKSLKGKYCSGDVIESSQCLVYIPPEPSLNVDFVELTDKCAGAIGVSVDLALTGTPPFRVAYRIFKDGYLVQNRDIRVDQSRHQFEVKPDTAGNYAYEFYSLDDDLYKGLPVTIDGNKFEQSIRALAGASFDEGSPRRRCCSGDNVSFKVKLTGNPPFALEYEISHGSSKKTKYSKEEIQEHELTIQTPDLKSGGRYTLSLVSVRDANGCKSVLNEQDAVVDVRRQRPAAAFLPIDGKMVVKALEGRSVGLPLRLSGEGPWSIQYRYLDVEANTYTDATLKVNNPNGDLLRVDRKGKYTLLDVHDAYCPGEVATAGTEFEVDWLTKPSMSVVSKSTQKIDDLSFVRNGVCEGAEDVFEVGLEGAPPFSIYYDVKGPINKFGEHMQVATKYASVKMLTSKAGQYKYTFNKVSDSIYGSSDMQQFSRPIVVEQTVNPLPSTGFVNKNKVYRACAHTEEDPNVEPIQVHFTGTPPFALTYCIRSESTGKSQQHTISNIAKRQYGLKSLYKGLSKGRHTVSLVMIQDSLGCSREMFNEENKVTIVVSDVPDVSALTPKTDFCVGERLSFGLTGIPPFDIVYEFNGKKQKASTNSPFSRLASQPGNLTLLTLTDSASSCIKNLNADIIRVHPRPSVQIDEMSNGAHDIHEGDQAELIFKFTGTPPFSFTYTRSEMVGRPARQKVVATHSVPRVDNYTYSIWTSMQGIYEIIAVQDAYCSVNTK